MIKIETFSASDMLIKNIPYREEEASDGCITQLFSTHFKSVYKPSVCTPIVRNDSPTFVDNLHITAAMLESSITNLKENNLALMVFLPFL